MSEENQSANGVLVVEDNPVNAMVNRLMLERLGVPVTIAENGKVALEKLREARFRLVLMDISMPEMDGVEATRIIRSGAEPGIDSAVPIIAITAHTLQGDAEEFLGAGMNACLSKPVSLEAMEETIRNFMV